MKTLLTTLALTAAVALPALAQENVSHAGTTFTLAKKDDNKALTSWDYIPKGQTAQTASKVFTVHRYKAPVKPEEAVKRVAEFNHQQKSLLMVDVPTNSICFVVKSGNIIEANAWRYAESGGKTWGNALQYRFPVDTKAGLADEIGPNSPFAKTCEGMKTWTMQYPK